MLNILGPQIRLCDGLNRRSFLKIGSLAMGGLSMSDVLRAEAAQGSRNSHKAIIMIFLPGGPPHQDMYDIKTEAPAEIRGEFRPIETAVPGIQICEHLPRIASMMDRFVPIRSIVGATGSHYAFQCHTGRPHQNQPPGGWPSIGATLSRLQGSGHPSTPAFVGLSPTMGHTPWADPGQSGFLGVAHSPFKPHGEGRDDLVLNGITAERLGDRRRLLTSLDTFRRNADASGMMSGLDSFNQQAFNVLTSSRLVDALDLSKEDPKTLERYGKGNPQPVADGAPRMMEHFLMARRLVESGVRCVTCAFGRWDWHGENFRSGREHLPMLDQGVSALVQDLDERGMLNDVSVVVWGEFGRTPKINTGAGRDHWPQVSCALLAGGGMRTGQVIGSTNRLGEVAQDRPVQFSEVLATLYHQMGLNPNRVTVNDLQGRPRYLVDDVDPMKELI